MSESSGDDPLTSSGSERDSSEDEGKSSVASCNLQTCFTLLILSLSLSLSSPPPLHPTHPSDVTKVNKVKLQKLKPPKSMMARLMKKPEATKANITRRPIPTTDMLTSDEDLLKKKMKLVKSVLKEAKKEGIDVPRSKLSLIHQMFS